MRTLALLCALALLASACGDDDNSGPDAAVDAGVDASPDAGPGPVSLDLGALYDVTTDASGVAQVTVATPNGDEVFLAMVQARSRTRATQEIWSIDAQPDLQRRHRVAPALATGPATAPPLRCGFDLAALRDLRDRLRGQPIPRGQLWPLPPPVPPPAEGSTVPFQVGTPSGVETIDASVLHVSPSLVIALDRTTDPSLSLDASDLQEIADGFEDVVLPRLRVFFGQESDVNADGHVTVLFSPLVAQTGTAFVNPYDLVTDPGSRPAGVAANDQELLYVTPPQLLDPQQATPRAMLETLAHEFQHAIYFYRKYLLNDQLNGNESVYITEGLSGLAQDLSGYQAGLFFINRAALDAWDLQSINDLVLSLGAYYMDRPELYGGAYLLMRYLYDQAGGDTLQSDGTVDTAASPGVPWLRALVDSSLLGEASIEDAAGQGVVALATDWLTALMVDDRDDDLGDPLNDDPRYNFLPPATDPITGRQRGTTMFETFMGMVQKTGPVVRDLADVNNAIRPGGSEYVRIEASSPGTLTVTVEADPTAVDPFVRLFRIH